MSAKPEFVTEFKGRPGEVYVGDNTWVSPFRLRRCTSDIRRLTSHLPLIIEVQGMKDDEVLPFLISRLPDSDAALVSFAESMKEIGEFHQGHAGAVNDLPQRGRRQDR